MASRALRSDGGGNKMGRGRTCRCIWHRDYVAQPAPSVRCGSGMYSQKMNNWNRISTRHRHASVPSTHLKGTKTQSHTTCSPSSLQLSPNPRVSSRVSGQALRTIKLKGVLGIQRVLQMFSPFSTGFTVSFSTDSSREFLEVLNEVFRLVLKSVL